MAEPFGLSMTFGYDAVGNRTIVLDSKGGVQTSTYDAGDRLTSRRETGNGGVMRIDYGYNGRDELTSINRYSNLAGTTRIGKTDNTYDASGRLVNQQHRDAANAVYLNTTYAYDAADRLTVQTDNGTPRTFTYDTTDQLTGDSTNTYTYDANGNRNNGSYATGSANQVSTDGTWTYSYDDSGNRTKKSLGASAETWTYQYDIANHLTRVEKRATDGGTLQLRIDYTYDVYGNRLSRTEYDGSLTVVSAQRFGYDGWKTGSGDSFVGQENWDVWADLDTSNALTTRRVFGNSIDDMAARITSAGVVGWYITDRQGSVREVVNAGGTPVNTITYDGFGHATQTNASAGDRYLYTGREVDAVADLIHLRDRVMALDLNVFLTKDRMGFAAGDLNLYRYVGNGFPNGTDPSGKLWFYVHRNDIHRWSDAFADAGIENQKLSVFTNFWGSKDGYGVLWIPNEQRNQVMGYLHEHWSNAFQDQVLALNIRKTVNDRVDNEEYRILLGNPNEGWPLKLARDIGVANGNVDRATDQSEKWDLDDQARRDKAQQSKESRPRAAFMTADTRTKRQQTWDAKQTARIVAAEEADRFARATGTGFYALQSNNRAFEGLFIDSAIETYRVGHDLTFGWDADNPLRSKSVGGFANGSRSLHGATFSIMMDGASTLGMAQIGVQGVRAVARGVSGKLLGSGAAAEFVGPVAPAAATDHAPHVFAQSRHQLQPRGVPYQHRTPDLPRQISLEELHRTRGIPGSEGVDLTAGSIDFSVYRRMREQAGRWDGAGYLGAGVLFLGNLVR